MIDNEILKKFILVKINTKNINNSALVGELYFGSISGYYDSLDYPKFEFDTEEDALNYIKKNKLYGNWTILPVYSCV